MLMSGFFSPAAVKTSITWPSVVMALETSWRMAASICSGVLRLLLLLLVQRGLQGLEEAHVVADLGRFIAGGAQGEGAGELHHHLHPALLAVFLFEDVLLPGGDEREALGGLAGGPLVPVEAVQHVAGDAVLFQHHGDGLRVSKVGSPWPPLSV
jgi:hypothetical protein